MKIIIMIMMMMMIILIDKYKEKSVAIQLLLIIWKERSEVLLEWIVQPGEPGWWRQACQAHQGASGRWQTGRSFPHCWGSTWKNAMACFTVSLWSEIPHKGNFYELNGVLLLLFSRTNSESQSGKVIHKKSVGKAGNSNFLNFPLSPLIFYVFFPALTFRVRPRK